MINMLSIQNFQSHETSSIKFSDGVNVIIGKSDSGKTAILRALNWIITNKPSGDSFRSNWGGDTNVTAYFWDNKKITRSRTGKENLYLSDGQEYKALGQTVPAAIYQEINLNDLNIQYQMDAPFLLSESPGEIARYFNRVANLDSIDMSLKNIDSKIRKLKSEISFSQDELQQQEKEIDLYSYIDKAMEDYKEIEAQQIQVDEIQRLIEKTQDILNRIYSLEKIDIDIDEAVQSLKEIDSDYIHISSLYEPMYFLEMIIDKYNNYNNKLQSVEKELQVSNKKLTSIMPDVCPLCGQPMEENK